MPTTTTINPEVEFPKVEKMLYKLAWSTSETYHIPFEEVRSEAYYAFMRACQDFDPTKGSKFSSWCYFWVWTQLKTYITRRTVEPLDFIEINEETLGETAPLRSDLLELAADLSNDAQEIIQMLIEVPEEMRGVPMTTRQLMKKVKDYLVQKRGRRQRDVERAHREIRICFQHALAT